MFLVSASCGYKAFSVAESTKKRPIHDAFYLATNVMIFLQCRLFRPIICHDNYKRGVE